MATKKAKRITYYIKGVAVYPHLDVPDAFTDPETGKTGVPKYSVKIKPSDADLKAFKAEMEKQAAELLPDCDRPGLPFHKNKTTKEITVKMASGAERKPPLFDAKNNKLPDGVVVGGGSLLNVRVALNAYEGFGGGINLYIDAVQVLELREDTFGKSPFEVTEGYAYEGNQSGSGDEADEGSKDESYAF